VNSLQAKLFDAYLASHHGVVSLAQALELGLSEEQVRWQVRTGVWTPIHAGIYRRTRESAGPSARLLAACLAAGPDAVASHVSAAWLWGLRPAPGGRPTVTVPSSRSCRPAGVTIRRRADLDATRTLVRNGIPVTDPVRTLADLGDVVGRADLDGAVDRALAAKLVGVAGLEQEIERLARYGRRGVGALRRSLEERGFAGPSPSVLESRTVRR
jgi:hypothetical protein